MEDPLTPNALPGPKPKKRWFRSFWFIGFLLIILGGAGYYGYSQLDNQQLLSRMFAQYARTHSTSTFSPADTIVPENSETGFRDTSLVEPDSVLVINYPELEEDTFTVSSEIIHSGILKENPAVDTVVTGYIDPPISNTIAEEIALPFSEGGLFEELLLNADHSGQEALSMNELFNEHIVSSKSVLKLLAIVGKNILSAENAVDDRNMLQVLEESDNISGILIVNNKGLVVYATNRKLLNRSLLRIMPEIDVNTMSLKWYKEGDQNIVSMPLYHTYGKVGIAILITG